jgi:hypothetical protein
MDGVEVPAYACIGVIPVSLMYCKVSSVIQSATVTQTVGTEVHTALIMKSCIVWDITPYSPSKVNRSLGETFSGSKNNPGNKPT